MGNENKFWYLTKTVKRGEFWESNIRTSVRLDKFCVTCFVLLFFKLDIGHKHVLPQNGSAVLSFCGIVCRTPRQHWCAGGFPILLNHSEAMFLAIPFWVDDGRWLFIGCHSPLHALSLKSGFIFETMCFCSNTIHHPPILPSLFAINHQTMDAVNRYKQL